MDRRNFIINPSWSIFVLVTICSVEQKDSPFAVMLGTAQDGGYPQAGCKKDCCKELWEDVSRRRDVTSLGIVDPVTEQRWFIEYTPSFPR